MELYKKYRPEKLNDIIGNESLIKTLQNAIESNDIPHAILLAGESGTGKTTVARILKEHLECGDMDFIEINCANHNGVEFARDVEQSILMSPISGKTRIWFLDEAHQLTTAAANVLLKPLEDTPKHVYFFLGTSMPDKLLSAVKTRLTPYVFEPFTNRNMTKLIRKVASKESIKISDESVDEIIKNSCGSGRMALVLLDQIKGLDEDEIKKTIEMTASRESQSIELARALIKRAKWGTVSAIIKDLKDDPETVRRVVLGYCNSVLLGGGDSCEIAFAIIQAFEDNFYNTGKVGLTKAAYDVTTA